MPEGIVKPSAYCLAFNLHVGSLECTECIISLYDLAIEQYWTIDSVKFLSGQLLYNTFNTFI